MASFGHLLRKALRAQRISQADLASQLGISQQSVSKWMTGETTPRVPMLQRIVALLHLDAFEVARALSGLDSLPPHSRIFHRLQELDGRQLEQVAAFLDELLGEDDE